MDTQEKVAPEHVFHFMDGKKAHNLHDLRDAINSMKDDVFAHHVDDANNDFANWVEFVYKNDALAVDLRQVKKASRMVELIDAELGKFSGENIDDEPVPEPEPPKQLHEDPVELSKPPQTMVTHDGKVVHAISTDAPHKFIVKEFFWGMLAGLLLGIVLMASLMYFGVFPGVA
jgi:hypothetical protein